MKTSKKRGLSPTSKLQMPAKNHLISTPTSSREYELFHAPAKKICLEAYKVSLPSTLLSINMEIYLWRNETQFPIVRTKYVAENTNRSLNELSVKLFVYNEHCPLKISRIYQMSLAQTLYIMKESVIGFQRLFSRFGLFQITEGMIGVNQNGFCRVWFNEIFSLNHYKTSARNQEEMLDSIYSIMKSHCQQNRATRKLFEALKDCRNFLTAIRELQHFIYTEKVLVPNKYMISNPSYRYFNSAKTIEFLRYQNKDENIRNSIISNKPKFRMESPIRIQNVQEIQMSPKSPKFKTIKKMKSSEKIKGTSIMKVSVGETAYSHNKQTKTSKLSYLLHNEKFGTKQNRGWLQDSRFVMEMNEDETSNEGKNKDKKELFHSTNFVLKDQSPTLPNLQKGLRKLSANICSTPKRQEPFHKQIYQKSLVQEFAKIINQSDDSPKFQRAHEGRRTIKQSINQAQSEQLALEKVEVMENIMKNNGWNKMKSMLATATAIQLKQSFHEGKDEQSPTKTFHLRKLESLGRRPPAMSLIDADLEEENI